MNVELVVGQEVFRQRADGRASQPLVLRRTVEVL